jgi:hypothetical protein
METWRLKFLLKQISVEQGNLNYFINDLFLASILSAC